MIIGIYQNGESVIEKYNSMEKGFDWTEKSIRHEYLAASE